MIKKVLDVKKYWRLFKNLTPSKSIIEVAYFVTSRCNFRCEHCLNWRSLDDGEKNPISIEELTKFASSLPKLIRVLLTGGEPFLRKDLDEICYVFYKYTDVKHISIPTNLSIPGTVKMVESILERCPGAYLNISPSLDCLGEERDRFVHRADSFKTFLEIYKELIKLSQKSKRLQVNVITTYNKDNEENINETFDYVTEVLKPDSYAVSLVRSIMKDGSYQRDLDMNKYEMIVKEVQAYNKERKGMSFAGAKMFIEVQRKLRDIVINTFRNDKYVIPCLSGKVRVVLKEDGAIYPCEVFMTEKPELSFGNLRNYNFNFKEIIKSPDSRRIVKYISKQNCFCHSECDYYYNILFNSKCFVKMFYNSYIGPARK